MATCQPIDSEMFYTDYFRFVNRNEQKRLNNDHLEFENVRFSPSFHLDNVVLLIINIRQKATPINWNGQTKSGRMRWNKCNLSPTKSILSHSSAITMRFLFYSLLLRVVNRQNNFHFFFLLCLFDDWWESQFNEMAEYLSNVKWCRNIKNYCLIQSNEPSLFPFDIPKKKIPAKKNRKYWIGNGEKNWCKLQIMHFSCCRLTPGNCNE